MDADVISIETARSQMELLEGFARYRYPAAIGPGVYDIHAPRVPDEAEMVALMRLAQRHLRPDQLWVNPDCGLKTRRRSEVHTSELQSLMRTSYDDLCLQKLIQHHITVVYLEV